MLVASFSGLYLFITHLHVIQWYNQHHQSLHTHISYFFAPSLLLTLNKASNHLIAFEANLHLIHLSSRPFSTFESRLPLPPSHRSRFSSCGAPRLRVFTFVFVFASHRRSPLLRFESYLVTSVSIEGVPSAKKRCRDGDSNRRPHPRSRELLTL